MVKKEPPNSCCGEASLSNAESPYDALKNQGNALTRKIRDTDLKLNNNVGELDIITYYLNSILSHMSQGLLFINLDGYITTCNVAAEQLLDLDDSGIIFHRYENHFTDNYFGFSMSEAIEKQQAPAKTFSLVTTGKSQQKELEIDTTFILQNSPSVPRALQGIIVLMRDITDLHRLQNSVHRRDRMQALGEMAAMVAHEIRNPLGSIKGFASLLERDLREQPAQHRMAQDIITGTDNLNRLVTNVLNYSRPLQTTFELVDVIELVRDLCRQVEVDSSIDQRIQIEFFSSLTDLKVPVDVCLLRSALLNIIANATQAMPEGGIVSIELDQDPQHAILKIKDTGVGISPEHLKKIFSPFFTTKNQGNGFGLAEVHRVVQAHAGTISVNSELGKGTTFNIQLPLSAYGNADACPVKTI